MFHGRTRDGLQESGDLRGLLCSASPQPPSFLPQAHLQQETTPVTQGLNASGRQNPSASVNEEKVKMHLIPGCLTKLGIQALPTGLEHDSSEILFEVAHTYFLHFDFLGKEEQFCHMGGTHTAFLPQVQNLHSEMASVSSSVGQIT